VRYSPPRLWLFSNLEYMPPRQLELIKVCQCAPTAMGVAVNDPKFQRDGLSASASIADVMRYFGISLAQLHEFSCDCGGYIDNSEQARRIERLA